MKEYPSGVIPAKGAFQKLARRPISIECIALVCYTPSFPRRRESSSAKGLRTFPWIPAFAGMTMGGVISGPGLICRGFWKVPFAGMTMGNLCENIWTRTLLDAFALRLAQVPLPLSRGLMYTVFNLAREGLLP